MAEPQAARLSIDLDALAHNYAVLVGEAVGAEVAAVVKADGYGLGAGPVGRRLWHEGARSFFVARLAEGEALRAALTPACPATIYILDGLTPASGPRLAAAGLTPVLSSLPQVGAAVAWGASCAIPPKVALHVDTGMNRQGLPADNARALLQSPDALKGLEVTLVMSHLGSAADVSNPRNSRQLAEFLQIRAALPNSRASVAASAGAFLGPDYRFDMVRGGVSLYGGGPQEIPDPRLKAVATLVAPILDIRNLRPGDAVGYGSGLTVDRPVRAAVIGAGYADGVIRAARHGGYGWVDGARRPFLIVNMDLLLLDLGDAEAAIGQQVELLGPNVWLDDLAAAAGTVAHEVLVRLGGRAERVYIGEV